LTGNVDTLMVLGVLEDLKNQYDMNQLSLAKELASDIFSNYH